MGRRNLADLSPARIRPGLPGSRRSASGPGLKRATIGQSAIILRFAGLYGPGRVVRRSLLERGEPIPGDPEKFLNLIHIDDAAQAAAAALEARHAEPLYVVSDDRPVTRREYYTRMADATGVAAPRFETVCARQPRGGT